VKYNISNNIIFEDHNLLVVNKLSKMPTVPLKNGGMGNTLLDAISQYCIDVKSFSGYSKHEGGVLHRLDTLTDGLVLIAKNKESFDFLINEQKKNNFEKNYIVRTTYSTKLMQGFFEFPFESIIENRSVVVESFFRHYGKGRKSVRPVMEDCSKIVLSKASKTKYKTIINFIKKEDNLFYFNCCLTNGFRHQIRCHLAWSGYPLIGDKLYGGIESDEFGLTCNSINFINPATKKRQTVCLEDKLL